jgi:plastocyanin
MQRLLPASTPILGAIGSMAVALGLAGGAAVVAAPLQTAQSWRVQAGTGTVDNSVATLQFYSSAITIDAGDSVTWNAVGDAHTVSFLSGAPAPNPDDPAAQAPSGGNSYDGTGIVSSGIFFPGPPGGLGPGAPPTSYTLTFSTPGTYVYDCLIHPGMEGTVTVQPAGTPYPETQAQYDAQSVLDSASALGAGVTLANAYQVTSSANAGGHTTYNVSAGVGNGAAASLAFIPVALTIAPGDTVTWTNTDPVEPHTVSFAGADGKLPAETDPAAVMPAGGTTEDGSTFNNSGFLAGPPGSPSNQPYSLTFPTAGIYNYVCIIHADLGMKGTIVVTK